MADSALALGLSSSLITLATWDRIVNPWRPTSEVEEFGQLYLSSLQRSIATKLLESVPRNADNEIYQRLYTADRRNTFLPAFVFVSANVTSGSIKFNDGKIEITSNALLVLLTVLGTLYTGVLHYEDAKKNILLINRDIKAVLETFGSRHGQIENESCTPVEPERILKELTIKQGTQWQNGPAPE